MQWQLHARTQLDSHTGIPVSETRFFRTTDWPRSLGGEVIIEVGSGAGRFTEQASKTGAMVLSLDYSSAVEANYASNGLLDNVLIVQGDVYQMPFKHACADRLFCLGVLQHTPDVDRAFQSLLPFLRPGGHLAIDVYRKRVFTTFTTTKYWVRPFTRHINQETLYRWCQRHVRLMWPLARAISSLPGGRSLNWRLLIPDYRGQYALSEKQLREWAVLDLFDMLSPRYDQPQSLATVTRWFKEAGLLDTTVEPGDNGIIGRGRMPQSQ